MLNSASTLCVSLRLCPGSGKGNAYGNLRSLRRGLQVSAQVAWPNCPVCKWHVVAAQELQRPTPDGLLEVARPARRLASPFAQATNQRHRRLPFRQRRANSSAPAGLSQKKKKELEQTAEKPLPLFRRSTEDIRFSCTLHFVSSARLHDLGRAMPAAKERRSSCMSQTQCIQLTPKSAHQMQSKLGVIMRGPHVVGKPICSSSRPPDFS